MFNIKVKKIDDSILIKWQLNKIKIPIAEIVDISIDDTYAGEDPSAIRIGFPYGTVERVRIKTKSSSYLLYTNSSSLKGKISSLL
ncbi:SunI/YnzG family protein [Bacillus sp. J33]|uniref:SunI/YnzG family protein n=1 Tax=Bacillus sp. J33 TaxID=935836 RepID=UPI00047D0FEC|nr:hypothetical protein [Bacillus sp. J33]